MRIALIGLIVAGVLPLALALRAQLRTSLFHALIWALAAWLSWGCAFALHADESVELEPARYCALCLTGCAGVAVLGARRPHVAAWNFVVLGLFVVMVLPLIETLILGTHPVDTLRIVFMAATIAVGILNYLPTRLGPAALVLGVAAAGEVAQLYVPAWLLNYGGVLPFDVSLTLAPWLAWISVRTRAVAAHEVDRLWLDFRDFWGLMWGQRVREQFNRAAENAGWDVTLRWRGLRVDDPQTDQKKIADMLQAALQRFRALD